MSGQSDSDTGANLLPDIYRFVRIRFQINRFLLSEKYANFIHRQGATDYKIIRRMDKIVEKFQRTVIVQKLR